MSEPTNAVVPPNPNGTTTDPGQGTKVLTASALPNNYTTLPKEQRLAWLDTQPSPWDNTMSLGTVFKRAETFNASMHIISDVLATFKAKYASKSSQDKGRKALFALIQAFNTLTYTLGNAQYADYHLLLQDGTVGNQLELEAGPFIDLSADEQPASLLAGFVKGLQLFVDEQPKLSQVSFGLGSMSAADIIIANVEAGKSFLKLYTDRDRGLSTEAPVQDPDQGQNDTDSKTLLSATEENVTLPLPRVVKPGATLEL
ncbi:uncharacterized protein FIESC28_00751 [Fusarium coffeatum]|uniref:Uncharacterized protein n=1 Tax=Fusarium coffeatum TaxID=231269 RepID=A0A366SAU8_9HYPO|nr:uncharacterized protein FIESC28_00751 [Fusarium coffeatum]RBR26457.1 hypothetical protein FIESC28_00751 [Fusarium coffeatum]